MRKQSDEQNLCRMINSIRRAQRDFDNIIAGGRSHERDPDLVAGTELINCQDLDLHHHVTALMASPCWTALNVVV